MGVLSVYMGCVLVRFEGVFLFFFLYVAMG